MQLRGKPSTLLQKVAFMGGEHFQLYQETEVLWDMFFVTSDSYPLMYVECPVKDLFKIRLKGTLWRGRMAEQTGVRKFVLYPSRYSKFKICEMQASKKVSCKAAEHCRCWMEKAGYWKWNGPSRTLWRGVKTVRLRQIVFSDPLKISIQFSFWFRQEPK